jgi:hypothetical protein
VLLHSVAFSVNLIRVHVIHASALAGLRCAACRAATACRSAGATMPAKAPAINVVTKRPEDLANSTPADFNLYLRCNGRHLDLSIEHRAAPGADCFSSR